MRAAALAGGDIPKLCATDTLKAFGSCRVCLVEIEGRKGFPASCTTEVAAGMKVRTHSEALTKLRRGVLELYVSEHPMGTCPDSQPLRARDPGARARHRRSRDIAGAADARGTSHTPKPVDASNPYFRFDNDLCIVCSRCVRACEDTQGTFALTIEGRGLESRVVRLAEPAVPRIRVRLLRRLRRGLSDGRADGEVASSPPACRSRRSPPPAPIAASAARWSRRSPTARSRAWSRTAMAAPTRVTPA